MMLINVSKNICCTSYVQRPGLRIQWGSGRWGKNRHMYRSWLSSTISPPPQAVPEPTSFFLNHCPYINACSVASTIFHLLIIFNEPGAWPRHSIFSYAVKWKSLSPGQLCLLSKKKINKSVPNPFCSKVRGKKPGAWWDHLSLFISPFSVEGWTEVLIVYRLVTEACEWSWWPQLIYFAFLCRRLNRSPHSLQAGDRSLWVKLSDWQHPSAPETVSMLFHEECKLPPKANLCIHF